MRTLLAQVILLTVLAIEVIAGPLDDWEWVQPLPQGNSLLSVAYGQGRFVAVGTGGTIVTSTNGIDWQNIPALVLEPLYGVTYGQGRFVAVGGAFDSVAPSLYQREISVILVSTNGLDWQDFSITNRSVLTCVIYARGRFLAMGTEGAALTSTNGQFWEKQTIPANVSVDECVSDGNNFLARVSRNCMTLTSTNGLDWIPGAFGPPFCSVQQIVAKPGLFVGVTGSNLLTSSDGLIWQRTITPLASHLSAIVWTGSKFFATGNGGEGIVSEDGFVWNSRPTGYDVSFKALATDGERIVGVGDKSLTAAFDLDGQILGITTNRWPNFYPISLATIDTTTVVLNGYGRGDALVITNPATELCPIQFSQPFPKIVRSVDGKFIAAASGGSLLSSSNGFDWEQHSTGTDGNLWNITKFQNLYLAIEQASNGYFFQAATNLDSWARTTPVPDNRVLYAMAANDRLALAVGPAGLVMSSTNGTDWKIEPPPTTRNLGDIVYGNGCFVASAIYYPGPYAGTHLTSQLLRTTDGQNWELVFATDATLSAFPGDVLDRLAFGNGFFVAVGSTITAVRGVAYYSPDGRRWHRSRAPIPIQANGISYGNGRFIAIGVFGSILRSGPIERLGLERSSSGEMELSFSGEIGGHRQIQISTNLIDWAELMIFTNNQSSLHFTVPEIESLNHQFYRVLRPQ